MAQTFKGDVDFTLHDKRCPHRFEVSVTDENKVVLWIEDRQSKKQWHTTALETKDFVTDDNAIPKATVVDYAERFAACLGAQEEATEYKQTLTVKGSERTLTLTFVLQWVSRELTVDYKFAMHEVPLERIDILGARLRDVEEKVEGGGGGTATGSPVYAQARTNGKHSANQALVWTAIDSGPVVFLSKGLVRFRAAGVYAVDVGVTHTSSNNGVVFELRKAHNVVLASCGTGSYGGYAITTPFRYIFKAEANDEVSVVYKGDSYANAGSYMTIVQL